MNYDLLHKTGSQPRRIFIYQKYKNKRKMKVVFYTFTVVINICFCLKYLLNYLDICR